MLDLSLCALGLHKTSYQRFEGWSQTCRPFTTRGEKIPGKWADQCKPQSVQLLQGSMEHHWHYLLLQPTDTDTHTHTGCGLSYWNTGTMDSKVLTTLKASWLTLLSPKIVNSLCLLFILKPHPPLLFFLCMQTVMSSCDSHLGQAAQVCSCLPFHWSTHCHNRPPHWRHPALLCPLWHLPCSLCDLLLGGVWWGEGSWTTVQWWTH